MSKVKELIIPDRVYIDDDSGGSISAKEFLILCIEDTPSETEDELRAVDSIADDIELCNGSVRLDKIDFDFLRKRYRMYLKTRYNKKSFRKLMISVSDAFDKAKDVDTNKKED